MNTLGSLIGGEIDLSSATGMRNATGPAPAPPPAIGPQPVAIAPPPSLPDPLTLPKLALRIERLLKEAKKATCGEERLDEVAAELRSIVPGLTGAISAARRRAAGEVLAKLYAPRFARLARLPFSTQYFASVIEARKLSGEFGNARVRGELFSKAQSIVELYRAECQNEVSVSD